MLQALAVGVTAFLGVQPARAQWYKVGDTGLETFNLTIDTTVTGVNAGGLTMTPYTAQPPGGTLAEQAAGYIDIPSPNTLNSVAKINTVCTDVLGHVNEHGAYLYSSVVFSGQQGIDPKWGSNAGNTLDTTKAAQAIQNAAFIFAGFGSVLTGGNVADKAALQLAVWAALYDTGSGQTWSTALTSGRFHINNNISNDPLAINKALFMLNSYLPSGTSGNVHQQYSGNLLKPKLSTAQEMLTTPTPVPEPTTVLAGLLLLLPFGVSTLRFIRKQSAA